ncbi:MAG: AAA family ATPase [Mycobacteriaceae bacterium]
MSEWANPAVVVRETHSGVVVLVGERAWKAKKPVSTGFCDFSTPGRREEALSRELSLNRRLAPDVYLGLAHVSDPAGGPAEPLLVMRRMPEDRRLATLAAAHAPLDGVISALAELLARFHAGARRGPDVDREGRAAAVRERWRGNVDRARGWSEGVLDAATLDRVDALAGAYLEGRGPLLDARIAAGDVLDGHADLLADDVFCLPDGPRVLDCLDFDDRLRFVDRLDDVAFLAMDLEQLGRVDLAEELHRSYDAAWASRGDGTASSLPTPALAPISLWHHYVAYRAFVRAQVECLQHVQGHHGAAERAQRYAGLTLDHLERSAVRLVLVGGLPGTGKTTVATGLADAVGAVVVSSDEVRRELLASGTVTGEAGVLDAGRYSPESTARVREDVLRRAGDLLTHGVSVVLDASWIDAGERADAAALGRRTCALLVELRTTAPAPLALRRTTSPRPGASEVTPAIAVVMGRRADPWPSACELDTSGTPGAAVGAAVREWTAAARG